MNLAPVDPSIALDVAADPGAFVVSCLERGKTWLAEALAHGDLDALVNAKGYAETLRVATMQKQLGKDAELAAAELVRRAERCIGVGIRRGQKAGEISRRSRHGSGDTTSMKPTDFAAPHELSSNGAGIYALTDGVTDEQFEAAIVEAKAEANLSRANVARKVKDDPAEGKLRHAIDLAASGHTTAQIAMLLGYSRRGMVEFLKRLDIEVPAEAVVGKQRNLDSTRIVAAAVDAINGIGMLFDRIDYAALDPNDISGWLPTLNDSIRSLTTLRNHLKEISQP